MKKIIKKYPQFYSSFECPNCGRIRVEEYKLEDDSSVHICEKCNWCIETNSYQDLWKQVIEKVDDKGKFLDFERYIEVLEDEK